MALACTKDDVALVCVDGAPRRAVTIACGSGLLSRAVEETAVMLLWKPEYSGEHNDKMYIERGVFSWRYPFEDATTGGALPDGFALRWATESRDSIELVSVKTVAEYGWTGRLTGHHRVVTRQHLIDYCLVPRWVDHERVRSEPRPRARTTQTDPHSELMRSIQAFRIDATN